MTVRILGDMSLDKWCALVERALAGDADAAAIVTDLDQNDFKKIVRIASERRKALAHAITVEHAAAVDPAKRAGPAAAELRATIDEASNSRGEARIAKALSAQHAMAVAARDVATATKR